MRSASTVPARCTSAASGRPQFDSTRTSTPSSPRSPIFHDARYLRHAVGTQLEDVPDVSYGQWVAEAHRDVHVSAKPWFGEVDAIIERSRQGAHRVRYRRLILPFSRLGGERLLVSASCIGRDIDLRVERA
jgi:hypothetical protein